MDIINDCLLFFKMYFKYSLPNCELVEERKEKIVSNLLLVTICFGNLELTIYLRLFFFAVLLCYHLFDEQNIFKDVFS